MRKVTIVYLVIALIIMIAYPIYVYSYSNKPYLLSKDGTIVVRVENKIETEELENGSYYKIRLSTHDKSRLSVVTVDKETFNLFKIGDLVSYERDEETGEINLYSYKNN